MTTSLRSLNEDLVQTYDDHDHRVAHGLLAVRPSCMIIGMACRSAWLALPLVVVAGIPGCGLSLDYLQCGAKCEDASSLVSSNGGGSDGSSGSDSIDDVADVTTENAQTSTSDDGGMDVVDAVSQVVASSDGPSDSFVPLGDACVLCGMSNCCGNHACVNTGTNCCSLVGADCGDNGACCGNLVCNALQRCADMCSSAGGMCKTASDCCSGTYCGSNNTCMLCLASGAACGMGQCCGYCVFDGGSALGVCRNGGN
jgi:hypothetical protein